MNKKMMVLLITASLMAGCADAIPDVPGTEEEVVVEWTTLNAEFTVLVGDDNNLTITPLLMMDMLAKMVCCLIVDMPQITGKRNYTSLISLMILL